MNPIFFDPFLRPQVWGGRKLGDLLGKTLPDSGTFGESWELSGHPLHISQVQSGDLKGAKLDSLWESGVHFGAEQQKSPFPLLIKILDCHQTLSVQVHPDDERAGMLLGDPFGKTETWIILECEPTGRIYAGFRKGVTKEEVSERSQDGTIDQALHTFQPKPGDVVHIPAGTVHAVGGGVLMAEVQQSSDATFRLFDWNRLGTDGKPRQLHVAQALECIDWDQGPVLPISNRTLSSSKENIIESPYYQIERIKFDRETVLGNGEQWSILMVLEGAISFTNSGEQVAVSGSEIKLVAGTTCLLPVLKNGDQWLVRASSPSVILRIYSEP